MPDRPVTRDAEPESPVFTHRQILYVVLSLLMGIFLTAMDQTIVGTSIRVIADDFGDFTQQAWVTTAYLVTSTIVTPLFGKLSDIFGRKPSYMFSIAMFMLGSLACAFSTSMLQLAIFRAVQGIGAGGLGVLSFTIIGEIVAPRERARYQGYFLATFSGASVLGPLVGGLFSDASSIAGITGWRWIFLINVPLGLIAMFMVYKVLRLRRARKAGVRVDWQGSVVLTVTLVPLLLAAELGQQWGWGSARAVSCFAVFGVGTVVFLWIERRMGDDALLPLHIFRNQRFAQGTILAFLIGTLLIGLFTLIPQYFQVVLGASPTRTGSLLLPMIAGTIAGALLSGQVIARTGRYRVHSLASAVLVLLSALSLYVLSGTSSLWALLPVTFALGLGIGCFNQPITVVMQNILPVRYIGVSTAVATFFRQIGGTIGVAFFLSLWLALSPSEIATRVSAAARQPAFRQGLARAASGASSPAARHLTSALSAGNTAAARNVVNNTSVLQALPGPVAEPFKQAFAASMSIPFLVATVISVASLVVLLYWKPVTLRAKSGAQEKAARQRAVPVPAPDQAADPG